MTKVYKIGNYAEGLSGGEFISNAQRLCKGKYERPTTIKECIRAMRAVGYTVYTKETNESKWVRP